ncbi:MAG: endonuclease [Candidatus Limimorpha sp.]
MIKLYLLCVLLTFTCVLSAQPQGYYDNAQGKVGNDLKIALHNIIKDDDHVSYKELLTAYERTDKKPDGTVWDIYSDVPNGIPPYVYNFSDNCGNYQEEGDCYNREHLWAQSWTNDDIYHKTDIHHVFPTDGYVNGRRSNYPFGEVGNAEWISQNGGRLGSCTTTGYSGTVFEPIDEYKGDIARALMYVSVRYYSEDGSWKSTDMTNKSEIKSWAIEMLLRWHEEDPVDQKEIDRNDEAFIVQKNRNPFVDYPEFAPMIWDPQWSGIENLDDMSVFVSVWPNPATSVINIKGENIGAIYVYNAMGSLVMTCYVPDSESHCRIDMSASDRGIYFMNIVATNGKSVLKKVVVQ